MPVAALRAVFGGLSPLESAGLAALTALAVLAAIVMLWWPLGFDQASFSVNGAKLVAGGLPYRDAWEMRGPLALYLFAGIQTVFGQTAFGVRLADVLALGAADVLLWRLVRRVASPAAALATVALWTLYYVSWTYNDTAQPDAWAAFAILAAAALASRPGGARGRDLLLGGAVVGACTLMKPFYPVFLAVPLAAVVARQGWRPAPLVRAALLLAVGCAVPVVLGVAAMVASGIWPAFFDSQFRYTRNVYALRDALTLPQRIERLFMFTVEGWRGPLFAIGIPAALVGVRALRRRGHAALAAVLVTMLLCGVFTIVLQGKFWFYHFASVLVPLAVLGAIGLAAAAEGDGVHEGSAGQTWARVSVVLIALVVAWQPITSVRWWGAYMRHRTTADGYYAAFGNGWTIDPADQRRAADFLRTHTPPNTPVAVWAVDAAVPFLAGRPSLSRFPVAVPLQIAPTSPQTRAFRQEYANVLREARPPYLIQGFHLERQNHDPVPPLDSLLPDVLGDYLSRHYVFDRRIGAINVYRRSDYVPRDTAARGR